MTELKPCPFCGCEAEFQHDYHEDDNRYPRDFWHVRVWCCYCCQGSDWEKYGAQEQKIAAPESKVLAEKNAAKDWNHRPIEDRLRAEKAELVEALQRILCMETPRGNATVIRMAKEAAAALKEIKGGCNDGGK